MGHHARFAPSSMDANFKCTARVPFIESFPTVPGDGGNVYTYEGTVAHAVAEKALRDWWEKDVDVSDALAVQKGRMWSYYINDLPDEFHTAQYVVDTEMLEYVQHYTDIIQELMQKCDDPELYIEHKVTVNEECYGTADIIIVDTDHVYVIDLKYGAGVAVQAKGNMQALTYLAGAMRGMQGQGVELPKIWHAIIVQPRIPSGEPYSEWKLTIQKVAQHAVLVDALVAEINSGDVEFQEGDHCRWCPVKVACPHLEKVARGQNLDTPFGDMDAAAVAGALEWANTAEFYIKTLREYAHDGIMAGTDVPGWKVVDKRAVTKWKPEMAGSVIETVEQFGLTHDQIVEHKLKTPTQIEKLIKGAGKKQKFRELLTHKTPSGTVLAPEDDKRPSVAPAKSKGQAKARQIAAIAMSK